MWLLITESKKLIDHLLIQLLNSNLDNDHWIGYELPNWIPINQFTDLVTKYKIEYRINWLLIQLSNIPSQLYIYATHLTWIVGTCVIIKEFSGCYTFVIIAPFYTIPGNPSHTHYLEHYITVFVVMQPPWCQVWCHNYANDITTTH